MSKNVNNQKDEIKDRLPSEIYALFAGIFPSTKYFDAKFDYLQVQIDEIRRNQELFRDDLKEFKKDVDYRFTQVDKRFEQVDKRFDEVNKRFDQIIASIDRLSDKLDKRDIEHRNFTLKMFSISIMISVLGVLGAFLKILGVL